MAGSTYFLEGYQLEGGDARYLYALRKDDDGTLYVNRTELIASGENITLFGTVPPPELENYSVPGNDYFDNRDPDTKELTYERSDVKYEQWLYSQNLVQHYINANGEFVISYGLDKPPYNEDTLVSNIPGGSLVPFTYTFAGPNYNVNLRASLLEAGWNGLSEVVVTNDGTIASGNVNVAALVISGSYPNVLTFINNNNVIGAPGYTTADGELIQPGPAIYVKTDCDITNTGNIVGGAALWTGGTDAYAIIGISYVTLSDTGTIGTTI
jgi:hypothetical protein